MRLRRIIKKEKGIASHFGRRVAIPIHQIASDMTSIIYHIVCVKSRNEMRGILWKIELSKQSAVLK